MDNDKIAELKIFVDQCKSNSSILHDPSLYFFRNYLRSVGAQIPKIQKQSSDKTNYETADNAIDHNEASKPYSYKDDDDDPDEIVESDIELDGDIVEPDNDPLQKMGDPSVEITEESRDAAQMSKAKAMDAFSEGNLVEAIEHLTEAIILNPSSAILYATRASVFVKMKKPNAAIRDSNAALKINPDSAKGYKFRGMARAMIGQWEEAVKDLHLASKLDYDDEIKLVLKKVEPNAQKIEEHRRRYERLCKQRELKKLERARKSRQAEAEASHTKEKQKENASQDKSESVASLHEGTVLSIHAAQELESKLSAASSLSRLVILYFTATWCGPCRFISPLYSSLAGKYPTVVFLKVDIDELRDVAARWNVNSVPTFFFMKNGKEVDKVVGADKSGLEKKIAFHAAQS